MWWTKLKRVNHGSYVEICPYGQHHMLETSWAWLEVFPTAIKCHRKCSVKMMDLLMTTMTLMMNALHLLKVKVKKIEECLTHAMNAPINIIWWLNIWQCLMWCSYSSFNLPCCMSNAATGFIIDISDNSKYVSPDLFHFIVMCHEWRKTQTILVTL